MSPYLARILSVTARHWSLHWCGISIARAPRRSDRLRVVRPLRDQPARAAVPDGCCTGAGCQEALC